VDRIRIVLKLPALLLVTAGSALAAAAARALFLGRVPAAPRWGSRFCLIWSRLACAILGVRRVVRGRPAGEPFVVAANHLSYLDIWVLGSLYPSIFVAKREISGWPFFGWVARNSGTLFVDRESGRDVVRAGKAMAEHLDGGISLTVFPEGGTSPGDAVRPFLSSILEPAARLETPCFAASITYETPGATEPPTRTICWSGGKPPFFYHLLGVLRLRQIDAFVTFSPVPYRSADRKELARTLWEETSRTFIPVRHERLPAAECTR
jgi:1-acyl-sn-glycerol-3-phosphate acyltransferase